MQEETTGNKAQDNHTDQTKRMFSLVSLYIWEFTSTVLNGVYTKQGKADYRAKQSQVKTLNRLNAKSKMQEERTGNKEKSNHIDQTKILFSLVIFFIWECTSTVLNSV